MAERKCDRNSREPPNVNFCAAEVRAVSSDGTCIYRQCREKVMTNVRMDDGRSINLGYLHYNIFHSDKKRTLVIYSAATNPTFAVADPENYQLDLKEIYYNVSRNYQDLILKIKDGFDDRKRKLESRKEELELQKTMMEDNIGVLVEQIEAMYAELESVSTNRKNFNEKEKQELEAKIEALEKEIKALRFKTDHLQQQVVACDSALMGMNTVAYENLQDYKPVDVMDLGPDLPAPSEELRKRWEAKKKELIEARKMKMQKPGVHVLLRVRCDELPPAAPDNSVLFQSGQEDGSSYVMFDGERISDDSKQNISVYSDLSAESCTTDNYTKEKEKMRKKRFKDLADSEQVKNDVKKRTRELEKKIDSRGEGQQDEDIADFLLKPYNPDISPEMRSYIRDFEVLRLISKRDMVKRSVSFILHSELQFFKEQDPNNKHYVKKVTIISFGSSGSGKTTFTQNLTSMILNMYHTNFSKHFAESTLYATFVEVRMDEKGDAKPIGMSSRVLRAESRDKFSASVSYAPIAIKRAPVCISNDESREAIQKCSSFAELQGKAEIIATYKELEKGTESNRQQRFTPANPSGSSRSFKITTLEFEAKDKTVWLRINIVDPPGAENFSDDEIRTALIAQQPQISQKFQNLFIGTLQREGVFINRELKVLSDRIMQFQAESRHKPESKENRLEKTWVEERHLLDPGTSVILLGCFKPYIKKSEESAVRGVFKTINEIVLV